MDFLAFHGGPFFELQRRLRLLQINALSAGKRAVIFVLLAWLVPCLIALAEGHGWGPVEQRPFLRDPMTWARFLIAIAMFILAERAVERQLRTILKQFWNAPLLLPSSSDDAAKAVTKALAARDSFWAEVVCALLAVIAVITAYTLLKQAEALSWAVVDDGQSRRLSLTAWWCLLVSTPLFWFLFLRGLWRHNVWAQLLRSLARLDLRLTATHPDGKGGLAFVGDYPNAFAMFVFGVSCVIGAVLSHQLLHETISMTVYGSIMTAWLVIVFAFFSYPLLAFTPPLARLKQSALLLAATQATNFHRSAEHKLLGRNVVADDRKDDGKEEIPDPSKFYDAAKKMSAYLLNRSALVPAAAAAVLPLAAAGATTLPYKEIFALVKKLLLL
ncbi:hypothetical protein [Taklimakanibacter deserti]|uniref:hypothetical protein n=1 Tax=Taklimakanibacter deserti TaxID=2267839 RepID=UPI0034D546EC